MNLFDQMYEKVTADLEEKLPPWLSYHDTAHTRLVLEKTIFIAQKEKITDYELFLLKTAALYHDTGYKTSSVEHEAESCRMARRELPAWGFTEEETDKICGMIMATRIPQQPQTRLEKILADADLEYLGTSQFETISSKLYKEMKHFSANLSLREWYDIQIKFISTHRYHTTWCRKHRDPAKRKNLAKLLEARERLI